MSTLSDLKARFFAAVTGKRNRTDAEMAYYGLAAAGAIPIVDPDGLEAGDTLSWDADEESWVAGPGGGGGGGGGGAVDSVNGKTGVVVLNAADVGAATEGYVDSAVSGVDVGVTSVNGKTGAAVLAAADVGAATESYVDGKLGTVTLGTGRVEASPGLTVEATGFYPATLSLDGAYGEAGLYGRSVRLGSAGSGAIVEALAPLALPGIPGEFVGDILDPPSGLVIYHTTLNKPVYYDGTNWCTFDGVPIL